MKVLVIGSGGREHALAWRLAQSHSVTEVYAAPGNPGIAQVARCVSPADGTPASFLQIATEFNIDLTVVGPEAALVAGVVDLFRAARRLIVGPTQANARLEGSKIFAKRFFAEHGIPTAGFYSVASRDEAHGVLDRTTYPIVLKADGLAAGKGVIIAADRHHAEHALDTLGEKLVIEEYLTGEEVSFIVLADGKDVIELEPCQDHKAAFDNDQGPNTGGMGAYCDSRILTVSERDNILDRIIRPTVAATGFTGFLYAGLMMTADGPKLLEYNVRLGDPETQPIMHRMVADFGQTLLALAGGCLRHAEVEWRPEPSVCLVLASEGYPARSRTGCVISGIEAAEATGATVFHAGTRQISNGLETSGGRVLSVTARGHDLQTAIDNAYRAAAEIRFEGMHYRLDIGRKGLSRWPTAPLQ